MVRRKRYQQTVNLLSELKYAALFALLLVCLPLTAFSWMPLHGLLGGLFLELEGWHIFFAVLCFFAVAWSLMICTGLLIDCVEERMKAAQKEKVRGLDYLSQAAMGFFNSQISLRQFAVFTLLGAVPAVIVVWKSDAVLLSALLFAVLGILGCYVVMVALCTPARLADPSFVPLLDVPPVHGLWRLLDRTFLPRFFKWLRVVVSWVLHYVGIRYALVYRIVEGKRRPLLRSDRFFAFSNFFGLLLVVIVVGGSYFPPYARATFPPAAAFLYLLLALALWIVLSLDCHLARIRVSPLLAIVLVMFLVWQVGGADHYYMVEDRPAPAGDRLTAVDVVRAGGDKRNVVVVSSAGGGILAAGWTTLVLEKLVDKRPRLADEIRLLSTISGGSVGAAHYVAARMAEAGVSAPGGVYASSVESSLAESAYGFAMLDFWRLFVGGWAPVINRWDRGRLQDDAWCRAASGGGRCPEHKPLSSLRPEVRAGRIPAVIFGATAMETGRRVMLTPISFESEPTRETPGNLVGRAPTLSEYLFPEGGREADLGLWTAARLSATFAYVSPAATARLEPSADPAARLSRGHHMLDGGYYENFGVTSAMDWIDEVLEARLRGEDLGFEKVLLVRLNSFRWTDPLCAEPKQGAISALLGPVLGLAAIRSGVAVTRNEIELDRFIAAWNQRLEKVGMGKEVIAQVEFRPPRQAAVGCQSDGPVEPLSWHLTKRQKEEQRAAWPDLCAPGEAEPGSIRDAWRKMERHLGAPPCKRAAA